MNTFKRHGFFWERLEAKIDFIGEQLNQVEYLQLKKELNIKYPPSK
jgi:hypothetical protein